MKLVGALASISSSRESDIVNSLVDFNKTGPYWIGADWWSVGLDGQRFVWNDNSPWNYTNWDKGRLSGRMQNGSSYCVHQGRAGPDPGPGTQKKCPSPVCSTHKLSFVSNIAKVREQQKIAMKSYEYP